MIMLKALTILMMLVAYCFLGHWLYSVTGNLPTTLASSIIVIELLLLAVLHSFFVTPTLISRGNDKWTNSFLEAIANLPSRWLGEKHNSAMMLSYVLWVTTSLIAILSFFPSVVDFRTLFWKQGKLPDVSVPFNLLVAVIPLVFSTYFTTVKRYLVSPFRRLFEGVEDSYYAHGRAHHRTALWHASGMLSVAEKTVGNINQMISAGSIDDEGWDGCCAAQVESFAPNVTVSSPRARRLRRLLEVNLKLHENYVALDHHCDHDKPLLKDIFLDILEKTQSQLLKRLGVLAQYNHALTPQFAAMSILENACKIEGIKGVYAVSLLTARRFHEFYHNAKIERVSKSRVTRRINVTDIPQLREEFSADIKALSEGRAANLPKGLGELFPRTENVPMFLWMVEWHFKNYWELLLIDKTTYELANHKDGEPTYPDYIVLSLPGHDLCVAANVENPQPHKWLDQTLMYYNVEAETEYSEVSRRRFGHFCALAEESVPLHDSARLFTDTLLDFELPNAKEGTISLRSILSLFAERTNSNTWVEERDDTGIAVGLDVAGSRAVSLS